MAVATKWPIRGSYFESCNCDPICPCRRIDDVAGGPLDARHLHGRPLLADRGGKRGRDGPRRARRCAGDPVRRRRAGLAVELGPLPRRAGRRRAARRRSRRSSRAARRRRARALPVGVEGEHSLGVRRVAIEVDHAGAGSRSASATTSPCGSATAFRAWKPSPASFPATTDGEELVDGSCGSTYGPFAFDFSGSCGYASIFATSAVDHARERKAPVVALRLALAGSPGWSSVVRLLPDGRGPVDRAQPARLVPSASWVVMMARDVLPLGDSHVAAYGSLIGPSAARRSASPPATSRSGASRRAPRGRPRLRTEVAIAGGGLAWDRAGSLSEPERRLLLTRRTTRSTGSGTAASAAPARRVDRPARDRGDLRAAAGRIVVRHAFWCDGCCSGTDGVASSLLASEHRMDGVRRGRNVALVKILTWRRVATG